MIPFNADAERAVLGSIRHDPRNMLRVMQTLSQSHFYVPENAIVYGAMVSLVNKHIPIDDVTLTTELSNQEKLEKIGGREYLEGLVANGENAQHYAAIVRDTWVKRNLVSAAKDIMGAAYDTTLDSEGALAKARSTLVGVGFEKTTGLESISEIGFRELELTEARFKNPYEPIGVQSGIKALDRAIGGFEKQDNIIIAGRPGSGKSSLADTIAVNAARQGKHVALFTMEMSKAQRFRRMACMESEFIFNEWKIRRRQNPDGSWRLWTDKEISDYMHVVCQTNVLPIFINDMSALRLDYIESTVGEIALDKPLDLVIVDYLGLMQDKHEKRYDQVGEISRGLKRIAKSMDVPMLNLAQLNRECEKRTDKKPELADLRDAGDIEQDADMVIFIWRPSVYWRTESEWRKTFPKDRYPGIEFAELNVAKNRNGETGYVNVGFNAPHMHFYDLGE